MQKLFLTLISLLLTACGSPYLATAPGSPLPASFAFCKSWDEVGRCKDWSPKTEKCINPKGINASPPTVPCISIKKLTASEK